MKKLLLILFAVILLSSMIQAETFAQSSDIQFVKSCTNSTSNVCSSIATCNLQIRSPINNTILVNNEAMTNNNNGFFNYSLTPTLTQNVGTYNWDMFCCDSNDCGEAHGSYEITLNGDILSIDRAMVYIASIIVMILLFIFTIYIFTWLPSENSYDDETQLLSINRLKYFRPVALFVAYIELIGIVFVSSNVAYLYLQNNLIGGFLFKIFLMMGYMIIPTLIICFFYYLYTAVTDKRLIKLFERGYDFSGGNK